MWMLPLIGSTASAISIMSLNTSNGASYCRKDFFVTSHCRAWQPMWPRAGRLSARHAARTTAQGPRSWNGRRRMNRSSRARTAHLRTRPFPDRRRGKAQRISCGLGLHVRGADVLVYVSMRTSASLRSAARSKARGDEAPHRHLHVVQPLSGLVRMMWAPS
jgi:hypothetical protein